MQRVPILDPQAVPVVGTDARLPPVAAERLTPVALRHRFERPPAWSPEFAGDGGRLAGREPAAASVLVPLVARPEGVGVLLTRRTEHLKDHAGQISFPGGRSEPGDGSVVETALREAEEEIGLGRAHVEVVGTMPEYRTVTGFEVTPVVALVKPEFELVLDPFEVAEAFEAPLEFLMNPSNHRRHRFEYDGGARQFLSMPWEGVDAGGGARRYFIWGATAAMLRNLYSFLAA
jgi:8-oxo-dGTP pyrophosphatase MutT (NUDIX family)